MTKHLVRKGHHRAWGIWPTPLCFQFSEQKTFTFTDSCWWWWNDPERDGDWSKIMGFVYGWQIHRESYRFGFRPNSRRGYGDFCPYYYQHGQRIPEPVVITKPLTETIRLAIYVVDGLVNFELNGELIFQVAPASKPWVGWTTDIYIGGGTSSGKDWAAPQDIILGC